MTAVPLYDYQQRGLDRLRDLGGRGGLFMEMGTGKTRVSLTYIAEVDCRRVLVVCPLTAIGVWKREVRKVNLPYAVLDLTDATAAQRRAMINASRQHDHVIALINYESYWREPLRSIIDRWKPDALIFDEAHRLRHRGTRQSRFAYVLADRAYTRVRLVLTGTPVTNGLQDAWGVLRAVDRNALGTYSDFENRYIIKGGYLGYQIVGYRHAEELKARIDELSFQCRKSEALTLPEEVDVPVAVPLCASTRRIYDQMRKKSLVEIQDALGQPKIAIARIVLSLLVRLQQIAAGFVREVGGEPVDISTEKLDATNELVRDALASGQKVVIFARFLHDLDQIMTKLGDLPIERIDGSVSSAARQRILDRFHEPDGPRILALQFRTGSEGIDLTPASVAVFMTTSFSLDQFLQARARLHRAGQRNPVTYYHLIAEKTVDEKIYAALQTKLDLASKITDLSYIADLFGGLNA